MYYLYALTGVLLLISFIANKEKTFRALKISIKRFVKIIPAFLAMLILVSIVLFLVPDKAILRYLGNDNSYLGILVASFFGSIIFMPGFIAFPLCGILLSKGVTYMVLSAFTTTLMMVGVLTFPIEKEYLGTKVTILRNFISLLIALIVALTTGFFFGELS